MSTNSNVLKELLKEEHSVAAAVEPTLAKRMRVLLQGFEGRIIDHSACDDDTLFDEATIAKDETILKEGQDTANCDDEILLAIASIYHPITQASARKDKREFFTKFGKDQDCVARALALVQKRNQENGDSEAYANALKQLGEQTGGEVFCPAFYRDMTFLLEEAQRAAVTPLADTAGVNKFAAKK